MAKLVKPVAGQLIPMSAFTSTNYWNKLNAEEQRTVAEQSQILGREMFNIQASRMEMGKRLVALRDIMEPKRCFLSHMRNFHINLRTAYRIIDDYQEANKYIPASALPVVMAMGYDFAKKSIKPILKRLPAPKSSDPSVVRPWAEEVESEHKKHMKRAMSRQENTEVVRAEPQELLKKAFRSVRVQFRKLPSNHKTRASWTEELVGMILTEMGVSNRQTFAPIAVPAEFSRGKGRPIVAEAVN